MSEKRYVCVIRAHMGKAETTDIARQQFFRLLNHLGVPYKERPDIWGQYKKQGTAAIGTFTTGKDVVDWWGEQKRLMNWSIFQLSGACGFTTSTRTLAKHLAETS